MDADWLSGVQLHFQNKQNGGEAVLKHKQNCSRGAQVVEAITGAMT